MSSQFWASNATKKRNELVPGTSKWVANELSTVNDVVLTHNEEIFQTFQDKVDHINAFMRNVLAGSDDRHTANALLDGIRRNTSPSHFTYIHPTTGSSPQASPLKPAPASTSLPDPSIQSKHMFPKTPSPYKLSPKTSPNIDSSFVPIARTIDPNKNVHREVPTQRKKSSIDTGADDSFQAISTAIRKSIAGKSAQLEEVKPAHPGPSLKEEAPRKSSSKTPKRSSIFVSLPSREPITITASSKPSSKRHTGVKSRSSRVYERLDIASRRETSSSLSKNMVLSPVALPKSAPLVSLDYKAVSLNNKPELHRPERAKLELPIAKASASNKNTIEKQHVIESKGNTSTPSLPNTQTSVKSSTRTPVLQDSRIPLLMKSKTSSPKMDKNSSTTLQHEQNIPSYMRSTSSRSNSSSPVRSPIKHQPGKKSPAKSPVKKAPVKRSPMKTRPALNKIESSETVDGPNLLNRLMAPTSSSAAKTRSQSPGKVSKPVAEIKKTDLNTKNRFLTTTLTPSNPQFQIQKPPQYPVSRTSSKLVTSPLKLNKNKDEPELKSSLKLEPASIPSLKKKSMMAERSEAAAQKPKHKITISMNHKVDLKASKGNSEKAQPPSSESSKRRKTDQSKSMVGNAVALPDVARGNLNKTQDSSKKSKFTKDSQLGDSVSKDILPKDLFKEEKTPGKSVSKSQILGKMATRISGARTPFKNRMANSIGPETPGRITPGNLPEIHSDEDDDESKSKVLKSWGHTPELHKIIMKNRTVDPASVFGVVPKINIEEIFESQASRIRGRQSPYISPDEKQRRNEERQYVLEMGYK